MKIIIEPKECRSLYWIFLFLFIGTACFYLVSIPFMMSVSGNEAMAVIKSGFFEFGKDGVVCFIDTGNCIAGYSIYIIIERMLMPVAAFFSIVFLILFLIFHRNYLEGLKKQSGQSSRHQDCGVAKRLSGLFFTNKNDAKKGPPEK